MWDVCTGGGPDEAGWTQHILLSRMPTNMKNKLLEEGDVIELTTAHTVYGMIPKHFAYGNCRGDFSLTRHEIRLYDQDFDYLRGKYIVVKITSDGGGTGMGPHDVFPDGYHVWCESIDGTHKVDFYQTGCFTAMIEDIKPIARAEKKWVLDTTLKSR